MCGPPGRKDSPCTDCSPCPKEVSDATAQQPVEAPWECLRAVAKVRSSHARAPLPPEAWLGPAVPGCPALKLLGASGPEGSVVQQVPAPRPALSPLPPGRRQLFGEMRRRD